MYWCIIVCLASSRAFEKICFFLNGEIEGMIVLHAISFNCWFVVVFFFIDFVVNFNVLQ